jgi:hypothetical protein
MNWLRTYPLIGLLLLITNQAYSNEICMPAQDLHQARKSLASVDFPGFGKAEVSTLRTISMYEKVVLGNDIYYAGVVDLATKNGWVFRYGGYDASVAWYGPIRLDEADLKGCETAKSVDLNNLVSRWSAKKSKTPRS